MPPILSRIKEMPWFVKLKTIFYPEKEIQKTFLYQDDIDKLSRLIVNEQVYQDVRRLESVVYNIEEYTHRLNQLHHALHGDTVFPMVLFELKLVKRCHFYLNSKGGYSDVQYLQQQFVKTATDVLIQHEVVLSMNDRSVQLDTTLYRSQTLFNNLRALIAQL